MPCRTFCFAENRRQWNWMQIEQKRQLSRSETATWVYWKQNTKKQTSCALQDARKAPAEQSPRSWLAWQERCPCQQSGFAQRRTVIRLPRPHAGLHSSSTSRALGERSHRQTLLACKDRWTCQPKASSENWKPCSGRKPPNQDILCRLWSRRLGTGQRDTPLLSVWAAVASLASGTHFSWPPALSTAWPYPSSPASFHCQPPKTVFMQRPLLQPPESQRQTFCCPSFLLPHLSSILLRSSCNPQPQFSQTWKYSKT